MGPGLHAFQMWSKIDRDQIPLGRLMKNDMINKWPKWRHELFKSQGQKFRSVY